MPILYSFRRCPYAIRARLAVASAGVTVELREVVLRDKAPESLLDSYEIERKAECRKTIQIAVKEEQSKRQLQSSRRPQTGGDGIV